MFSLEAVKAGHGDCLLLHWGTEDDPHVALIDGGPGGIYQDYLKPRLAELAEERAVDLLPLDLVMLSHIDDDHIRGLLDLADEIERDEVPVRIKRLWHNSLEGLLDADLAAETAALKTATASLGKLPVETHDHWYSAVLASVPQGQKLHGFAKRKGLHTTMNLPFQPLVMRRDGQQPAKFSGLKLTVVAPALTEVEALRVQWKKKRKDSITAAFSDKSPYNLSSIVVLAEYDGKRMLLTGDARGDHIIAGLEELGLMDGGRFHVDLLKLPHHGSRNNVTPEFFGTVTADTYVVSGDCSTKSYPNPHKEAMGWLAAARGDEEYTICCTYDLKHMRDLFANRLRLPKGKNALSVTAPLLP